MMAIWASAPLKHHDALAIDKVPGFVKALRAHDAEPATKLSLEWMILCASRQNEVRFAAWDEIDMANRTWTIPAERMKAKVEHVVPLTERCMAILSEAKPLNQGNAGLIFEGNKGRPMSENTHANLAKSVAGDDSLTAHGFRSTFWCIFWGMVASLWSRIESRNWHGPTCSCGAAHFYWQFCSDGLSRWKPTRSDRL